MNTDLYARPAEEGDQKARDDRRVQTFFGVVPEAIASAMDSGSATIATVKPAIRSLLRSDM